MDEYNKSICRSCFHSYVCEQFNEHRDSCNQKCHFLNDHYVPAADVAPVVHGLWEFKHPNGWACSNCGEWGLMIDNRGICKSNYCPNCGAKMGVEVSNGVKD